MDIQVNKHQLERVALKWLNTYYGDLTLKNKKGVNNRSFYVNKGNLVIMESYNTTKRIFVHPDIIFNPIMTMFHLSKTDTYSILQEWLKETYDNDYEVRDGYGYNKFGVGSVLEEPQ
jgi:hypothetical protein